jgi:hypothetical protein
MKLMSKMSNYLEKKLLDHVLTNTAYTPPTKVYLALFTSDPTDAGSGTEITGGAYARQEITFGAASSPGGTSSTTADIVFPVATANWGIVSHVGIYDASTAGNLLFHGALNTARTINIDNQLVILAGELTVVLD